MDNNNSLTKTKYKYTINNVKYPVYKTKNNKHIAMVGGKKKYVDMTKHPSFKGGTGENEKKRSQQGSPQGSHSLKQPRVESKTCMTDLPDDVINLIAKFAFNTQPELEQFNNLNVPTTEASKKNIDELLQLYQTITGVGMSSRNAAKHGLSAVLNLSPQQVNTEFTAWGQDWRIKDFGFEMQKLLEGDHTPISLLWKKADGLGDDLLITYSVKQTNGSNTGTDTMVRIFLDKLPQYADHSIKFPIKMSRVSNIPNDIMTYAEHKQFISSSNSNSSIELNINEFMTKKRTEYGNYTLMKDMYDILYDEVPKQLKLDNHNWYIKKAQYIRIPEPRDGNKGQTMEEDMVYIHTYYEYPSQQQALGGRRNFRKTTPPSRNPKTSPVVRKATTSATTNATRRSTSSSGVSNTTSTSARRSKKN